MHRAGRDITLSTQCNTFGISVDSSAVTSINQRPFSRLDWSFMMTSRVIMSGLCRPGYDWVGWSNESRKGKPVELTFEFDVVRNFSTAYLHTNNMFSKGARVSCQLGWPLYFCWFFSCSPRRGYISALGGSTTIRCPSSFITLVTQN